MRRVSEITRERPSPRKSVVTVTVRTPELARALTGSARAAQWLVWAIGTSALAAFAWHGGFGLTAHATIKFCIADAALFWATHTIAKHWQNLSAATTDRLVVTLDDRAIEIRFQGTATSIQRDHDELRFPARPDP